MKSSEVIQKPEPASLDVVFVDMDDTICHTSLFRNEFRKFQNKELDTKPKLKFVDGAFELIGKLKTEGKKVCVISHSYSGYRSAAVDVKAELARQGIKVDAFVTLKETFDTLTFNPNYLVSVVTGCVYGQKPDILKISVVKEECLNFLSRHENQTAIQSGGVLTQNDINLCINILSGKTGKSHLLPHQLSGVAKTLVGCIGKQDSDFMARVAFKKLGINPDDVATPIKVTVIGDHLDDVVFADRIAQGCASVSYSRAINIRVPELQEAGNEREWRSKRIAQLREGVRTGVVPTPLEVHEVSSFECVQEIMDQKLGLHPIGESGDSLSTAASSSHGEKTYQSPVAQILSGTRKS